MHILSVKYSDDMKGYSVHHHDAHELLYIASGAISVNIGGEDRIAGAGSLLIFSRFEEHSVRILTSEYRRYSLLVSSEISHRSDNYLLSSVLINRSRGFRHIIDCGDSSEVIELIMKDMSDEALRKLPMFEKILDASLIRLLVELYRISPDLFLADENKNTEIVRSIQSKFESDYSDNFTLSSLASQYHISPSHLAHIFKNITGYAPIDYLLSCRLSAAKSLLGTTDKSIKEIIDLCGFSDESNFSRMFRSKVGITPSEFRRQNYPKSLDK